MTFDRWPTKQSASCDIFDSTESISYVDPRQGGAGTCYMMQAMGCIGEFPELVRNVFLTETKNAAGIHGIQFYIRGKPWHVSIDDKLTYYYSRLEFAQASADGRAIWGAILEKAWAKVKGNYMIADGGYIANGLRSLTGVPVFDYYLGSYTTESELNTLH